MTRRLHSLLQHDSEHVGRVVRTQISLVQRRLNSLRSLHLTFQANGQTGAVDTSKLWTDYGARAHVTRHVLSLTHLPTVLNLLRALSIEFNLSRLDVLSSVGRRLRKKETATAAASALHITAVVILTTCHGIASAQFLHNTPAAGAIFAVGSLVRLILSGRPRDRFQLFFFRLNSRFVCFILLQLLSKICVHFSALTKAGVAAAGHPFAVLCNQTRYALTFGVEMVGIGTTFGAKRGGAG